MKNAKSQSHIILHKPLPSNEAESWRPAGKTRCKRKVQWLKRMHRTGHRPVMIPIPWDLIGAVAQNDCWQAPWGGLASPQGPWPSRGVQVRGNLVDYRHEGSWGLSLITGFGVLGFQIYTDFRARLGPSGVDVVHYGLVHSSKKTIDKTEKEDFTKAKNFYKEAVWMM